MKRLFATRSTVLALSVLLLAGSPVAALAESNLWNPKNWFGSSVESDAEQARKRAEAAKRQADLALEEARKAQERAEQALREAGAAAEAKNRKAQKGEKPIVTRSDTKPAVEVGAPTTPSVIQTTGTYRESMPNFTEKSTAVQSETPKNAGWNLLNLFSKETAEDRAEKPAAKAPARESATEESKAGWGIKNLFARNADSAAEPAPEPQPATPLTDPAIRNQAAVIETEKGNIAIELYPEQAPITVNNFVKLVNEGFYNKFNMKFHRVVPGFVIQTGDPTGTGAGGSKERIPLEAKNKLSHNAKGVVAMARGPDPNSATSQFYITLAPQTSLDGKYAIFGKVISGIDVLDKIEKDDMLYGIKFVNISEVTRDPAPEKKKLFSMF